MGGAPSPTRPPASPLHSSDFHSSINSSILCSLCWRCLWPYTSWVAACKRDCLSSSMTKSRLQRWSFCDWSCTRPDPEHSPRPRVNLNLTFGRTIPLSITLVENYQSMLYKHQSVSVLLAVFFSSSGARELAVVFNQRKFRGVMILNYKFSAFLRWWCVSYSSPLYLPMLMQKEPAFGCALHLWGETKGSCEI